MLSKLPDVVREKVVTQLRHGAEGMAAVKQPKLLLSVLLLSVVHWGLIGISIQCSLWAFDIQADIVTVSLLLGLVILSTSIPTSPGNVGTVQLAYTLGLQTNGASASVIVAASVFYHVLAYVSVLVVAVLFLSQFGYSWRRLKQDISSKNP